MCKSRRIAAETEAASLRKDLQRTRDRLTQTQRDLNQTNEQVKLTPPKYLVFVGIVFLLSLILSLSLTISLVVFLEVQPKAGY